MNQIVWLLSEGLLNPEDVRTMLSRHSVGSLIERHGLDANEWPSLRAVTPPPSAQRKKPPQQETAQPVAPEPAPAPTMPLPAPAPATTVSSHRGWGAIPPERSRDQRQTDGRSPSVIVLDWNVKGSAPSPPPVPKPKARSSSPVMQKVFANLRSYMKKTGSNSPTVVVPDSPDAGTTTGAGVQHLPQPYVPHSSRRCVA